MSFCCPTQCIPYEAGNDVAFYPFPNKCLLLWHPVAISVSCVDRDLYCWGLALCVYVALPVTVGGLVNKLLSYKSEGEPHSLRKL
jgi:hypothetical protein